MEAREYFFRLSYQQYQKVTVPARAEEISVRESVGTDFLGTLYKKAAISAKDGCLFFQFIFNLDPVI